MTNVLIAVDESDEAVAAAEAAHKLFGDSAKYFVMNVNNPVAAIPFADGYAFPMVPIYTTAADVEAAQLAANPSLAASTASTDNVPQSIDAAAEQAADHVAHDVVEKAALEGAETIGEVGDPATHILDAAKHHAIDVIVVASHERSWFARLVTGSVTSQVLKRSAIPVLVVK